MNDKIMVYRFGTFYTFAHTQLSDIYQFHSEPFMFRDDPSFNDFPVIPKTEYAKKKSIAKSSSSICSHKEEVLENSFNLTFLFFMLNSVVFGSVRVACVGQVGHTAPYTCRLSILVSFPERLYGVFIIHL